MPSLRSANPLARQVVPKKPLARLFSPTSRTTPPWNHRQSHKKKAKLDSISEIGRLIEGAVGLDFSGIWNPDRAQDKERKAKQQDEKGDEKCEDQDGGKAISNESKGDKG